MILTKFENSNASQLFKILIGVEAQNKKNEPGMGGHSMASMVSNGLSLLYKTEVYT